MRERRHAVKTESEIERLLDICLVAVYGSKTEEDRKINAAMASGIAWVLGIPGPTERVDAMIERCNLIDSRNARKKRQAANGNRPDAGGAA